MTPVCRPANVEGTPGSRRKPRLIRLGYASSAAVAIACLPTPLFAHDAFGDLGPFYASLLHPLADPMQAALIVGTGAFLAGRPLAVARVALPVFIGAASMIAITVFAGASISAPPILATIAVLLIGASAMLPDAWTPLPMVLALVSATGAFAALAPGAAPDGATLQAVLGTTVGIAGFATLSWWGGDAASRRLTPIAPQVAGSWVAAIGILVMAFSL
jgi:hypothetical protein